MGPKGSRRGGNRDTKIYAEKDWKYNGDFHSLDTFNQRVRSELAEKSTLGDKILNGNIEIDKTMLEAKSDGITNLMLASADPEGTRARFKFKNLFTDEEAKVGGQEGPINYEHIQRIRRPEVERTDD